VEQGKHYVCDGRDLVKPTADQYERYNDGSHRGKKKLENNDKAEAEKKRAEVRTKAGEKAKKTEVAGTSRELDLTESMKRREEQEAVQNAGKINARKREDILELERAAAEKTLWAEQQRKDSDQKKKTAREEWQRNLAVEERKKEDKIQFNKSLAKALEIEGNVEPAAVKKGGRKDMTSAELDAEFMELNEAQMRANTRAAVDQVVSARLSARKEVSKSSVGCARMMRVEGEEVKKLPPVLVLLDRGEVEVRTLNHVQVTKGRVAKKVMKVPTPVLEEMELEGEELEIDFEGERREVNVAEIPQDILDEVIQTIQEERQGTQVGPVENISVTFLESLVSDGMDVDLGEEDEERVREIASELRESGREVESSPSREIKEELIEQERDKQGRRTGDGKVSSESAEEVERIIIDDSSEVESFMVRAAGHGEDELEVPGDIPTPTRESTPYSGHEKDIKKPRQVIAPKKKLWVQTETGEDVTEEEEDRKSSIDSSESEVKRSPLSAASSGRALTQERDMPTHLREPRSFGDRATRTHVRFNDRTGMREVTSELNGEDEILTGGGDGERKLRVRRVTARSWLEGYGSDEDEGTEDIDDQLYRIIDGMPFPWTISRALRIAVQRYPQRAPWYLRMKISTILITMRKTSQNILTRSIWTAPAVNQQTSMIVPLNLDVVTRYFDTSN